MYKFSWVLERISGISSTSFQPCPQLIPERWTCRLLGVLVTKFWSWDYPERVFRVSHIRRQVYPQPASTTACCRLPSNCLYETPMRGGGGGVDLYGMPTGGTRFLKMFRYWAFILFAREKVGICRTSDGTCWRFKKCVRAESHGSDCSERKSKKMDTTRRRSFLQWEAARAIWKSRLLSEEIVEVDFQS